MASDTPVLLDYQRKFVADRSRFLVANWARRTGKTMTVCYRIARDLVLAEAEARAIRWVILSRGERQARAAMEDWLIPHLRAITKAVELTETTQQFGGIEYQALTVRLPHGSRCICLPANADTARGVGGNVFLDEFAFHKDPEKIWQAVFPIVTDRPDGTLLVASTPNGRGNRFHQLMTSTRHAQDWSRTKVTIHDAKAAGLDRDIELIRRTMADDIGFRQEFECEFLEDGLAFLPYDIIDAAERVDVGVPALYQGGHCYVGWDVARRGHLSVFSVLEDVHRRLVTREISIMQTQSFRAQLAELGRIMYGYRVVAVNIDQTGMGEMPVEEAKSLYGQSRVNGVIFGPASRLDLATGLRDALEDRRLDIPRDDALRADLHSMRRYGGTSPRLVAEGDTDGHADRFWSLALAVAGAREPGLAYRGYEAARPQRPRFDVDETDDELSRSHSRGWMRGAA